MESMETNIASVSGFDQDETEAEKVGPMTNLDNPTKVYSFGSLVWGRFSRVKWWPGIVIDGALAGQPPANQGSAWIMWFGDYKISKLPYSKIGGFGEHFKEHAENLCKLAEQGVNEALQVCATRLGVPLDGADSIKIWAQAPEGFTSHVLYDSGQPNLLAPKVGEEYPELVLRTLQDLSGLRSKRCMSDMATGSSRQNQSKRHKSDKHDWTNKHLVDRQFTEENLATSCLACSNLIGSTEPSVQHPLFEGLLCQPCKEDVLESMFAFDVDGSFAYCSICADSGKMLVCEAKNCGRSYCMFCLSRCIGQDALTKIENLPESVSWACFLCSDYSLDTHGVLKPRTDWQYHVFQIFNLQDTQRTEDNTYKMGSRKQKNRGIRVLSLGDGIGAVRTALDQLDVDVEDYYAAEIKDEARAIPENKHDPVHSISNLLDIDEAKLKSLAPIDLVVAAPPVPSIEEKQEDEKLLPLQKCIWIIQQLQAMVSEEEGGGLHWLLETKTTIPKHVRKDLSHSLKMEPVMWDAQLFSPVLLPKLYWGNIEGIDSTVSYFSQHGLQTDLEKYLVNDQHFQREPWVTHVRPEVLIGLPFRKKYELIREEESVHEGRPTRTFDIDQHQMVSHVRPEVLIGLPFRKKYELIREEESVFAGRPTRTYDIDQHQKVEDPLHFQLPVHWNGFNSEIFTDEMERLMGFPDSYTDLTLKKSKRLKLLSNSSSVHVLKHLLTPLAEQFACVTRTTPVPFWKTNKLHFMYNRDTDSFW